MSTSTTQSRNDATRDPRQLARLFESLPPHALEAEMSLLGSMLIEPQVIGDVVLVIKTGDDFFKPANGAIFDAMVDLYDKHASMDIVQLNQMLADRDVLSSVGGLDYLVQLANAVPTAANASRYAGLVRDKATIRQLISAAGDILYDAYNSPEAAQEILDQAENKIFHIAQQVESGQIESLHELIRQTMEMLEANEGKTLTGQPSGFTELDEMMGGLQAGEMVILAARPSMGKTAFALNMAENIAMKNIGVGVFSLEMGKQQLVQRLLTARSGIDSQRLRRNMLRPDDYRALMTACDELLPAPLYIDDTPGLSLLQMRAKARRMVQKHQVKAIIIDYMQLMSSGGRVESRQMEVSEISRGIKAMARELELPVVCLSQLNRAAEQREGHRPRMSDLRESGSIEQDADVVMMLHREEYYYQSDPSWAEENPEKIGLAELIIAKQQNGPTGSIKLTWNNKSTQFRDHTTARPPGGTYYEPKNSGEGGTGGGGFAPSPSKGQVENYRDGGGPDRDDFDADIPI